MERCDDAPAVIADVNPVANLHAVAIDRQGNVGQRIGDEQRDQLLGELVRAVIIGAARDHCVHAVRVIGGTDQKIGRGLAGGVRTIRGQRRGLAERRLLGFERAVDFIGRDLNIARGSGLSGRVQQALGSQDIRPQERHGVVDRAVDMALGREIDDGVVASPRQPVSEPWTVGDIAMDEMISRIGGEFGEVVGITSVCQAVQIGDRDVRVIFKQESDEVGADEAAAPGHEYPSDRELRVHPRLRSVLSRQFLL